MSLNGLDAAELQEAYQSALLEAGGWFLLKYVSRDAVELLGQGKAGVAEARNAVAQYTEKSPLYGLIVYRRRKVLIKYIPEGTSRLLQARTAVHFQDVVEKYSPFDTLLEHSTAEGLSDTSLAASFPLHTASPSASTAKLGEISEDGEEDGAAKRAINSSTSVGSIASPRQVMEKKMERTRRLKGSPQQQSPPRIQINNEKPMAMQPKTAVSQFLVREESGHRSITPLSPPPVTELIPSDASAKDLDPVPNAQKTEEQKGPTRAPASPLNEEYDLSYLGWKPKVKLGPRLVTEKHRRPNVMTVPAQVRSAAALPPGHRVASKPVSPATSLSQGPASAPAFVAPLLPPIPHVPEYAPRPSSRGSIRSLPSSRSGTMTAEKQRLMKAIELRKKQLRKSNPVQNVSVGTVETPATNVPSMPSVPQEYQASVPSEGGKTSADFPSGDSAIGIDYRRSSQVASVPEGTPEPQASSTENASDKNAAELTPLITGATRKLEEFLQTSQSAETNTHGSSALDKNYNDPAGVAPQRSSPFLPATIAEDATQKASEARSRRLSFDGNTMDDKFVEDDDLDGSGRTTPIPQSPRRNNSDLQKKRRGWVEPLHIPANTEHPDHDLDYLSDDSFMEELQSATVLEAKPISVSKSPATPCFTRRPSTNSTMSARSGKSIHSISLVERYSSNPLSVPRFPTTAAPDRLLPESYFPTTSRSYSVTLPRTPDLESQDPVTIAKKMNVSSGISRRIQALAEHRSNQPAPSSTLSSMPSLPLTPAASPNQYLATRKTSLRSPTHSRGPSLTRLRRQSHKTSSYPSPVASPSAGATAASSDVQYSVHEGSSNGNRESVSVTARIIRSSDASQQCQSGAQNDDVRTEFHQSPLIVNHRRAAPSQDGITQPAPVSKPESVPAMPSQSKHVFPAQSPVSRESVATSRKSHGRHRSNELKNPSPSPGNRAGSAASNFSYEEEKKGSRTSRLFKRMSAMGGGGKRRSVAQTNAASPSPVAQDDTAPPDPARSPSLPDRPPAITIGDLNVQFPDTLLWKRRLVELDANGYLVFNVSTTNDHHHGVTKRFHLSDFRRPDVPDLDRQELPNSVVLELGDGSTLQCACEDSMAQAQVLSILCQAHRAWTS
ncbi:hypothetical protein LTR66_010482 [Elasticomyces elasticus]|nr:hypothetical protein LTR66_010482 [Elasticomyces elasticus]